MLLMRDFGLMSDPHFLLLLAVTELATASVPSRSVSSIAMPTFSCYALTLADAVAKNCGLTAHQELASRSFTQTLARICLDRNTHATVKKRCYGLVKEWAGEFDDASLDLMKETYESLKSQDAVAEEDPTPKTREPTSDQLRAEDEELRRALELSIRTKAVETSHVLQHSAGIGFRLFRSRRLQLLFSTTIHAAVLRTADSATEHLHK